MNELEAVISENKDLCLKYKELIDGCKNRVQEHRIKVIRKAFEIAVEAHKEMRRKSGEPYIYHPIEVAIIVSQELGLGATSIASALLHDVIEDTDITKENIQQIFGAEIAKIVDGLTKITGIYDRNISTQAENFKKIIFTLADDVRVILIKLADRLHNMRTLAAMPRNKQVRISQETAFLYAPLAHRLGLYSIKTELEDLAFKYTEPEIYAEIEEKVKQTEQGRRHFIQRFSLPISHSLTEAGFKFDIKGRTKSIYSIYKKMKAKDIPFEEVYDLFAIRIIIETPRETERLNIWHVYSLITDIYKPNQERLRDWVGTPKANGYESLHATVLAQKGRWVEAQVRSKRMDEIAERGYAAHWKYKDSASKESGLEQWLANVREIIENLGKQDINAVDFLDDFKLSLFTEEINVFTPNGEIKTMPKGATALDFAYEIHTDLGNHCIGAKANQKLIPISTPLNTGDIVEIITSKKQTPKNEWLEFVVTSRAKTKIKTALKKELKQKAYKGIDILKRKLGYLKSEVNEDIINEMTHFFELSNKYVFLQQVYDGIISIKDLKRFIDEKKSYNWYRKIRKTISKGIRRTSKIEEKDSSIKTEMPDIKKLVIGNKKELDYSLAKCCNPIPGDEVFGYVTQNEGIKIHKVSCPNAKHLMAHFKERIIQADWSKKSAVEFNTAIEIVGIDSIGLIHELSGTLSNELHVNMRSIHFDAVDNYFKGTVSLDVTGTGHLDSLIKRLKKIKGIKKIVRKDSV